MRPIKADLTKLDEIISKQYEDKISDKHADIIVSYGDKGKFVFGRESSYLPRWESGGKYWYVEEVVTRKKGGY